MLHEYLSNCPGPTLVLGGRVGSPTSKLHACLVAQSLLTLCDPMDYRLPGYSIHWIFQARILKWVVISSSRGSS